MGFGGEGMLLGGRCGLSGWGIVENCDEVAAAWRGGWNLLVILDFFSDIFYSWRNIFLGEKQEMSPGETLVFELRDVS